MFYSSACTNNVSALDGSYSVHWWPLSVLQFCMYLQRLCLVAVLAFIGDPEVFCSSAFTYAGSMTGNISVECVTPKCSTMSACVTTCLGECSYSFRWWPLSVCTILHVLTAALWSAVLAGRCVHTVAGWCVHTVAGRCVHTVAGWCVHTG